jgi:CheY-like chemotaxis protein
MAPSDPVRPAHPGAERPGRPKGLRILLVEDDPDLAETTARIVSTAGHEVQLCSDGPSALRAAQEEPPDVVLLDIGLPGMDGYEVARRLRQQPPGLRPLLIALTAYGRDTEERLKSYQAGIDLHLTKPVGAEELQHFLQCYQAVVTP